MRAMRGRNQEKRQTVEVMNQTKLTRARRLIQQNDEQINARLVLDDAGFDRLWNAVNETENDMSKVNFLTSPDESRTIGKIVDRAKSLLPELKVDWVSLHMDLSACHANGCPLRLNDLLAADDFNFSHDVFGINRHIDRKTGKLNDCFLPRFAEQQDASI